MTVAAGKRTLGAAAAAVLVTLVIATGASLTGSTDRSAPPDPGETPTVEGVGPDRFLRPADLPASVPFARWTGSAESRDMVGAPVCTTMVKGSPESSRLLEFTSATAGVRGYQAVAAYPSIALATAAAEQIEARLRSCRDKLGRTARVADEYDAAGDGYQVLFDTSGTGSVELTVHARAGRLVSVLWITSEDPAPVDQGTALNLLAASRVRLTGSEASVDAGTPVDPLEAAMLESVDISGGSARYDDIAESAPEQDGTLPSVAHPCGRPDPIDGVMLKTFTGSPGVVLVLQRIMVARSAHAARDAALALLPTARGCSVRGTTAVDRADGVAETLLTYGAQVELDREATVHVAIAQVGTVVTEIVLVDRRDDGVGQSRFFAPLVETAIDRILSTLAEVAFPATRATVDELLTLAATNSGADTAAFADTVLLGLAGAATLTVPGNELADPVAWVLPYQQFREREGAFSALAVLASSARRYTVTTGGHRSCASAPLPQPPTLSGYRQVSAQSTRPRSCIEWWSVDIFLDDHDRVRGVILDLGSP